ncbi:homeobox protein Rhox13-like [Sigmodon hispidus]
MAHLQNYKDNFYYHFGDDEEDRGPHPQHVAAAEKGGSIQEGALSLEDSESQHDNPNKGEHMQPYNSLCPDSDQSNPEPMEVDPQEPSLELAEVQRPQASRHQKQFHFTQWQVQEMEKVFQETQYRDVLKRQELARNFNVPEATVQELLWSHIGAMDAVGEIQVDAGSNRDIKGFSCIKLLKFSSVEHT